MKEESGKQAQLNTQMAKILKKRDKEYAQLQDELAGAQAKAVQLAVENERLKQQVAFSALSCAAHHAVCMPFKMRRRRSVPCLVCIVVQLWLPVSLSGKGASLMSCDACHMLLLEMSCACMQKGGDATAAAQLERLQAQNGMLQKVSRKLQEEVRLLRIGQSVPEINVKGEHSLDSLQQSPSDEKSPSELPLQA